MSAQHFALLGVLERRGRADKGRYGAAWSGACGCGYCAVGGVSVVGDRVEWFGEPGVVW
jgi:hypothetical protein